MFVKLLHGLHNVIAGFIQKWTKDNLPPIVNTEHDFEDGLGKVPAIPMDEPTLNNELQDFRETENYLDKIGINNSIETFYETDNYLHNDIAISFIFIFI